MKTEVNTKGNGFAEITKIRKNLIGVHLYNQALDTVFRLNYYHHRNSALVCLTGDDFENMYGHMLGQGHSGGGMMGHMQNNETERMHHLNDEHKEDDEHFGGFDTHNHTFGYRFSITQGKVTNYMQFRGKKE